MLRPFPQVLSDASLEIPEGLENLNILQAEVKILLPFSKHIPFTTFT
jgi:hypothetical protein